MTHSELNAENKILALIPAYNEAERISPVVIETMKFLPVLVIDDGSIDRTAQTAAEIGAEVLKQQPNQGKGAALKAGFRYALDQEYAAVVALDADGQHDPEEIPKFTHRFAETGADLIIGARDFSEMPLIRRTANWLGKAALSWAMRETILDNQSGYRLISRSLLKDMTEIEEEGFEFEVEMIIHCLRKGCSLEWVEIRTIYAGESSHINPITHLVKYIRLVLKTRESLKGRTEKIA